MAGPEPTWQAAQLLRLTGKDDAAVASILGVSLERARELVREGERRARELPLPEPSPPADTLPPEHFKGALRDPDHVYVGNHISPVAIADPATYGDFEVSYNDSIAKGLPVSVEASVEEIRRFPGVRSASCEARGLIFVWGQGVDMRALEGHLRTWWRQRLLGESDE